MRPAPCSSAGVKETSQWIFVFVQKSVDWIFWLPSAIEIHFWNLGLNSSACESSALIHLAWPFSTIR
jgi:hypothetical protein